jgi:hypothetical protein
MLLSASHPPSSLIRTNDGYPPPGPAALPMLAHSRVPFPASRRGLRQRQVKDVSPMPFTATETPRTVVSNGTALARRSTAGFLQAKIRRTSPRYPRSDDQTVRRRMRSSKVISSRL